MSGLEVIGAGYGRTGTDSLRSALNQLGYKCYHMHECADNDDFTQWVQADDELRTKGQSEALNGIFQQKGYSATVHFPASIYYKDLLKQNPNAKVVVTVRNPETWWKSTLATIWAPGGYEFSAIIACTPKGAKMQKACRRYIARVLRLPLADATAAKLRPLLEDKAHMVANFNQHVESVKAAVPPSQLLVFSVADGWEPLCSFLGKPVPETPFPNVNDKGHFTNKLNTIKTIVCVLYSSVAAGLVGVAVLLGATA
jgi:hypothetical protein